MRQRFRSYGIFILFTGFISFPFFNKTFSLIKDIPSFENRRMASKPDMDINHLDPFPAHYDTFYNENFELRNRLIRYFNLYNILLFRKSPFPDKLIVGRDNWLFTTGDEMDSYMGKNRFTNEELQEFKTELEYRKKYLESNNCKFYFLVVPCKASIHEEKVGYEYFRMNPQSWGEQLNEYLEKNSVVKPINVFDLLRKKRTPHDLYYALDNHWNDIGAFYTVSEVILRMKTDFPQLEAMDLNDYEIKKGGIHGGNIQKMLGNLDIFSEPSVLVEPRKGFKAREVEKSGYPPVEGFAYPWGYETVKEIKGSTKPRLLIISDSFGENAFAFLPENFSRSVKIFDAWLYRLNEDVVEAEKPDAMLLMIDEPILRSFLKNPSAPSLKEKNK